ncbi:MAG: cupredoxin domain-containing protein [Actinomycetota bacterium]
MRSPFPLVAALLLLGGCTGQEDRGGFGNPPPPLESPSPVPVETVTDEPTQVVRVSAPGGFRYEPGALRIRAGELTEFEFSNEDGQEHTFVISELAVVMLAGAGQTVQSTVAIDPKNTGEFAYFCSIGGHRTEGMEGTAVVR